MRRLLASLAVVLALAPPAVAGQLRTAPTGDVSALAARSATCLSRLLHADVPQRPVIEHEASGYDGLTWPDRTYIRPAVWSQLERIAAERSLAYVWPSAVHVLIHEQLHTGRNGGLEEGVVDAEAWDVAPAWGRCALGLRYLAADAPRYRVEVAAVRRWSAAVTGQPWRSRAAREARRALWALPSPAREVAYGSVP